MKEVQRIVSDATKLIAAAKKIAVVGHIRPDGDAVGSVLGMTSALLDYGKDAYALFDGKLPEKYAILRGADKAMQEGEGFDLVIFCDCADFSRAGCLTSLLGKRNVKSINLDHHKTNDRFADVNLVLPNVASTCEIVFAVLEALKLPISSATANCLYTGLLTDSGSFANTNVNQNCFDAASKLVALGADPNAIATAIVKSSSRERLSLLARAIASIRYFENGTLAVMTISAKMFDETGAERNDTEGMIDYALNVNGVRAAACLMESGKNTFKVSFRSKKDVDISKAAMSFGGGGHAQAAGCVLNGFYEDVVEKVVRSMELEL